MISNNLSRTIRGEREMPSIFDVFDSNKRRFNKEMGEERRKRAKLSKGQQARMIHNCLESLAYLTNREASYTRDLNQKYEGEYEVIEWRPPLYVEREARPGGEVRWQYSTKENSHERMVSLIESGLVALIDCNISDVERNIEVDGRTTRIKVKTYSGIPVRRLDGDRMGKPLSD